MSDRAPGLYGPDRARTREGEAALYGFERQTGYWMREFVTTTHALLRDGFGETEANLTAAGVSWAVLTAPNGHTVAWPTRVPNLCELDNLIS